MENVSEGSQNCFQERVVGVSRLVYHTATAYGTELFSLLKAVLMSPSADGTMTSAEAEDVVVVDWSQLVEQETTKQLRESIQKAFGLDGNGVIVIRGVPDFVEAKKTFLNMAHGLATLPESYLEEKLTDKPSLYNAGWSHGKEKLGDKADTAKGSYYYNPVTDQPGSATDREKYPLSYPCNVWPDESRLPSFKAAAVKIGRVLHECVATLSLHLDNVAHSQKHSYPEGLLYNELKSTEKVKARLLYYFPLDPSSNDVKKQDDSWIGWHNDSGFLTALAGEIYVDHATGKEIECPDPLAGLYVATRQGPRHVTIPSDCMAIQMGECAQIVSGGVFSATPHCVRGVTNHSGVARVSLPCFVDTPPMYELCKPVDSTEKEVLNSAIPHPRVPPLGQRWTNGISFGDFLQKTFSLYYDWTS